MAPNFDFDPTKDTATTEIYPKDDYEIQVGEPKSFLRTAAKDTPDEHLSYGVRFPLTIRGGEYDGKKINNFSIYHHSDGARTMGKQFLMAVLGYGRSKSEEQRFNEDMAGKDWKCDYETGAVGDAFRELTGKRVIGSLDVQKNKQSGEEQQAFKGWRPVSGS